MPKSKSIPSSLPSSSKSGVARRQATAASAAVSRLRRLEQLIRDTLPEPGDERELEYHFRDSLRWA